MVRLLFISGMVFFAVLIGGTAHRLQEMYKDGTLFKQFNHERKVTITLLAVSSGSLAALCFIEIRRLKRRFEHPDVIKTVEKKPAPVEDESDCTSIYSAPEAIDAWQGRQQPVIMEKPSRFHMFPSVHSLELTGLWMSLLRIYCGVLPVIYTYTLLNYLFAWLPSGAGTVVLSVLFPLLFLGSVLTSVGVLRRKIWGIKFGYAVAIFHLLIFPFGTALGFLMLIVLAGATDEFHGPGRKRSRSTRKAKRKKTQSAPV